ncbi:hypothetical protein [Photobacterium nomapromontoriensis]|uniref:hypothetical protein n=1 Tax=Photobacterium nomapromontoriensis TaxID=2910237 RepID=UPI003D125878
MIKLQLLTAASTILVSSYALANIHVADTHNGAWVTVTNNGQPAANSSVSITNVPQHREMYKTDKNGRVFIPITLENSQSIKYKATNEYGEESSRFYFHSINR